MAKTPRGEGTHPRRCIAVNECIARWMFKSQNTKCVINPALSQQARAKDAVRRADVAKRVLIVGAGPSGCEAAIGAQLHLVRRRLPPHRDDEHDQRLQGRVRGLSPSMSVSAHKSHNAILTATRPSYWPQARSAQVTEGAIDAVEMPATGTTPDGDLVTVHGDTEIAMFRDPLVCGAEPPRQAQLAVRRRRNRH